LTGETLLFEDWATTAEEHLTLSVADHSLSAVVLRQKIDLVERGILCRRHWEEDPPAFIFDHVRFVRTIARLQFATLTILDRWGVLADPDERLLFETELAQGVDLALSRDDQYLAHLLSLPDIARGPGLARLDAFHGDMQWYDTLTSRLRDEPEPDRAYAIKSRLDQLAASIDGIGDTANTGDDLSREAARCQEECRQLDREYLDRRIADELTYPLESASPLSLWNRRFQLSRLEADRMASCESTAKTGMLGTLETRQQQLADLAEDRLIALPETQQRQLVEDLVLAAQEESNDILTLVEDIPLRVGVELLRANVSDFRRLTGSLDRLSRSTRASDLRRMTRRSKTELQEKRLALRLENLLGKRWVGRLENLILLLILILTGLIIVEGILSWSGRLSLPLQAFFAWSDLLICSIFLAEFLLKISLAPDRWRYLRRHWLIDLVASIPFGFITFQAGQLETLAGEASLLRLLRFLRLPQLIRYLRLAQPIVRMGRLIFFLLRTTDRLVRRNAAVFNRNIVLFEPDAIGVEEPSYRLRLIRLREHFQQRMRELTATLSPADRVERVSRTLIDLRIRLESLPTTAVAEPVRRSIVKRDLYAEEVVRDLLDMTPERLVQRLGTGFPESVARYVRFLDVPLIRRLPVIRDLVASRDQGAGHVAALAANFLGYLLRSLLEIGYFLADLQGTISGPIFLDRFGMILVKATSRNAYRLIYLALGIFLLSTFAWLLGIVFLEALARKLKTVFVLPVIILGLACFLIMLLGRWLRWLANQSSEEGERLVEAQFAAQTKILKKSFVEVDLDFLADRVVLPELTLRTLDDPTPSAQAPTLAKAKAELEDAAQRLLRPTAHAPSSQPGDGGLSEEMLFLRTVSLLHLDYQDSGIFRPTDTKMTTQLLGNLALANFRQSALNISTREAERDRSLEAARLSGGLFGGSYLWFNYMTRIITEETAKLLRDYNKNAVPLCRLPSASAEVRERYRVWLSQRLGRPKEHVSLPEPLGRYGGQATTLADDPHRADEFFETVEFTTMDFLTYGSDREQEIRRRFGPELAKLLKIDRKRAIRQAFRSFPLHRFPEAYRTINPLTLYLDYAAGGRILLLPARIIWWSIRGMGILTGAFQRTVRDILQPRVSNSAAVDADSFAIALRKIHRMRKPCVLASIWMRAKFDAEYLGIGVPGVPITVGSPTLFDDDLNFIGSTRRERLMAERLVINQRQQVDLLHPVLLRLGVPIDNLNAFLSQHYPYLAHRSAEVMRAITAAWMVNERGIRDLATSIDALRRIVSAIVQSEGSTFTMPADLPPFRLNGSRRWLRGWWFGSKRSVQKGLDRLGLAPMDPGTRTRVVKQLLRHWAIIHDWIQEVESIPAGVDPCDVVQSRWREIILRTDLWSDQLVVLRTLQTLSLLDVYHYCRVVWNLGGYGERNHVPFPASLPTKAGRALSDPAARD
jgi:hypothetical protein